MKLRLLLALGLACCVLGCAMDSGEAANEPAPEAGEETSSETAVETSVETSIEDSGTTGDTTTDVADTSPPCPNVRIDVGAGSTLNVRATPSTSATIVGKLPNNAIVPVLERVMGEAVSGNAEWMKVDVSPTDGYVSAAFAKCTTDPAPVLTAPAAWYLPLECGKSARISQGNDGSTSHQGKAFYAFDFAIPVNTPLVAMADGIVTYTYAETGPGDPCYDGGPRRVSRTRTTSCSVMATAPVRSTSTSTRSSSRWASSFPRARPWVSRARRVIRPVRTRT